MGGNATCRPKPKLGALWKIWRCQAPESPVIMVMPLQLKTKDHHFNLVEHFNIFPKSSRSSKLEFGAKVMSKI
jgi:hypothetical protein